MAEQKNQRECAVHIFVPSKDAWRQESFILCNRIGGSWQDQAFRLFLVDTYFCWNIFFSIVASYLNAPKLLRANLFLMNFVEKKIIFKHGIKFAFDHHSMHAIRATFCSTLFFYQCSLSTIIQAVIVGRLEPMHRRSYKYGRGRLANHQLVCVQWRNTRYLNYMFTPEAFSVQFAANKYFPRPFLYDGIKMTIKWLERKMQMNMK